MSITFNRLVGEVIPQALGAKSDRGFRSENARKSDSIRDAAQNTIAPGAKR